MRAAWNVGARQAAGLSFSQSADLLLLCCLSLGFTANGSNRENILLMRGQRSEWA